MVADTRRVVTATDTAVSNPMLTLPYTDESDAHTQLSDPDPPTRSDGDESAWKNADDPNTVTDTDPVVGAFVPIIELTDTPNVTADVKLARIVPDVTATLNAIDVPALTLNTTDVSEFHFVDSSPLPPTRPHTLLSTRPTCLPITVTLVAPVVAELPRITLLGDRFTPA